MDTAPDPLSFRHNPGYAVGSQVGAALDVGRLMGSWTGAPPLLGAPVSGALWGAGLGALLGAGQEMFAAQPSRGQGFWRSRLGRGLLLGALGGGAVGIGSGLTQHFKQNHHKQANSREEVARIIRTNYQIPPAEKQRLLQALAGADYLQLQRLAAVAAAGGLTALAASKILGLGGFGSALFGGVGALLANNYFRPSTTWV